MEFRNYSDDEDDSGAEETLTSLKHHYGTTTNSGGSGRNNPLLETISVIEFDSDDGNGMLYTGSVDSGYKSSCCPTPDHYPVAQIPQSSELDLDHLSSLRKTLLTAIERYDSRTKELLHPARFRRSASPEPSGPASLPVMPTLGSTNDEATNSSADVTDGSGSRFSRVARCMLEIIEDLQRQREEPSAAPAEAALPPAAAPSAPAPSVPPKPIRMSKINIRNNNVGIPCETSAPPLPPATPPRVARKGRRKLPTPQPPPLPAEDLSGADYHLYEEILYDLGTSQPWSASVSCNPPPLPARPSRTLKPEVVPPTSSSWMKHVIPIKPLIRRDRNNQLIRPMLTKDSNSIQNSRSNVYTFGNHPTNRRNNAAPHHTEDEYGFRAAMV